MLAPNGNGTFLCGPLDVVCVLHDVNTGKYHAAFFEERPFPGPILPVSETKIVRLMSKMHRTDGADNISGALEHMSELAENLGVPEQNRWTDPREWDGEIGIVWLVPNWAKES